MVADKILAELARPVEIGGHEIHVTPSIGISHYPERRDRRAPAAQARRQRDVPGQGRGAQHHPLLHQRPQFPARPSAWRSRRACARRSRTRSSSCATSRRWTSPRAHISGMEALIRWNDPQKGEIFPKDFIFVAEELGLIVPIGRMGLPHRLPAARALGRTTGCRRSPSRSTSRRASSCRAGSCPRCSRSCARPGADPRRIELEITETMIMRNLEQSIETLSQLRSVGHAGRGGRLRRGLLLAGPADAPARLEHEDRPLVHHERADGRLERARSPRRSSPWPSD